MQEIYDIADDSYYLYTCAQIKARENEFVDKSKLERMISSKRPDDFYKVLSETIYSPMVNDLRERRDFKRITVAAYREIFDFLAQRSKEEHIAVIELLFMEEYIHNIKVILKSAILETDLGGQFLEIFDPYRMVMDAVKNEKFDDINPFSAILIKKALELKDMEKGMEAELELETYFIHRLVKKTSLVGSQMLVDYLRHKIDIMNIKNISRCRFVGLKLDFEKFVHNGGFLEKDFFIKQQKESSDYFVKSLENTDYADIAIRGTNSLFTYNTFASFEKNEDIFYLDFFDGLKYTVANVEKVFFFFLRKKIELEVLNIIYSGVLYDIDKTRLRHRAEVLSEN